MMSRSHVLDGYLENWTACQRVTLGFLGEISASRYHLRPFGRRFRSFAWEFGCILTTRQMYVRGFESGRLDGQTACDSDEVVESLSVQEMENSLGETFKVVQTLVRANHDRPIAFFGQETDGVVVFSWLLQHEQLHYGKLMLYFAQAGLDLPSELKEMWGEQSFRA
jgi:hypothetical protein